MNAPLPLPPTNQEDDDTYYRALLQNLIARGADLAARIHESAIAPTTPETPATQAPTIEPQTTHTQTTHTQTTLAQATIAYDRILRAIRRSIALARHIATHPIGAPQPPQAKKRPPNSPARARLTRAIQLAAQRAQGDNNAIMPRLLERLDDVELEHGVDGQPIEQVIGEICEELGIELPRRTYVWKQQTARDLAPPAPNHTLSLVPHAPNPYYPAPHARKPPA